MGAGLLSVQIGIYLFSLRFISEFHNKQAGERIGFISFSTINTLEREREREREGAGLLAVKSGFILFNRIYQFFNNKHA